MHKKNSKLVKKIHIHNLPRKKKTKNDAAQVAALDALRSRANVLPTITRKTAFLLEGGYVC